MSSYDAICNCGHHERFHGQKKTRECSQCGCSHYVEGEVDPPMMFQDVTRFHDKFGLRYEGKPRALIGDLLEFRLGFLTEELEEYKRACEGAWRVLDGVEKYETGSDTPIEHYLENALDSLVDLVYVALGSAQLHGFDFDEAWRRVQAANMAKMRVKRAEDSKRGSTYDVVKPEGWTPPDHRNLVEDHAHRQPELPVESEEDRLRRENEELRRQVQTLQDADEELL